MNRLTLVPHHRLLCLAAFVLPTLSGCLPATSDSIPLPSAAASLGSASTPRGDRTDGTEWILVIAVGLPEELKEQLKAEIANLVEQRALPGDTIHVVRAPDHQPVASLVIPNLSGRQRLRHPQVARHLARIGQLFHETSQISPDYRQQLQVPHLPETVWGLRRGSGPLRIVLIGDPVYHDPHEPLWSMADGRYPTDGSLTHDQSNCPFRNIGRTKIPPDAEINWLTVGAQWGLNKQHREKVERFYRLAFQSELGGTLRRATSDPATAFERAEDGGMPAPVVPDTDSQPGMVTISRTIPTEVQLAIDHALRSPDQILLAINWSSSDPNSDIDMWIGSNGKAVELNFAQMQADFGELHRDVRHSGGDHIDNRDFRKWEFAVIHHDRLADLTLWLNAYETRAVARVRLITVWKGKQCVHFVDLDATEGDHALGRFRRSSSSAWLKVDLVGIYESDSPAAM